MSASFEVGKTYVTRDGRKAGPLRAFPGFCYVFEGAIEGGDTTQWTASGKYWQGGGDDNRDLVKEFIAPLADSLSYQVAALEAKCAALEAERDKMQTRLNEILAAVVGNC